MTHTLPPGADVLIDSNLAILLVTGSSGSGNIARHKRLREYDETDFRLLDDLLSARNLVFSPHVLAETSNLLRYAKAPLKDELSGVLKTLVESSSELQASAKEIVQDADFIRLGITDAALLTILDAHPALVLITVDLDLYWSALARGHDAVNFAHIRDLRPDFR